MTAAWLACCRVKPGQLGQQQQVCACTACLCWQPASTLYPGECCTFCTVYASRGMACRTSLVQSMHAASPTHSNLLAEPSRWPDPADAAAQSLATALFWPCCRPSQPDRRRCRRHWWLCCRSSSGRGRRLRCRCPCGQCGGWGAANAAAPPPEPPSGTLGEITRPGEQGKFHRWATSCRLHVSSSKL